MSLYSSGLYLPLLLVSSTILLILWLLAIQQLCITKLNDKKRLKRVIWVLVFGTLCVILNSLVYSSSIYLNFTWVGPAHKIWNLSMLFHVVELLTVLTGFHIGQMVLSSMIDNIYSHILTPPKWKKLLLYAVEFFIIIAILIGYTFSFIVYKNMFGILLFYIVMKVTIIVEDAYVLYIMKSMDNALRTTQTVDSDKLESAINSIKIARFLLIMIVIICICYLSFSIWEIKHNYMGVSLNLTHIADLLHSSLAIAVFTFFEWWIFKKECNCCVMEKKKYIDVPSEKPDFPQRLLNDSNAPKYSSISLQNNSDMM
eukprot:114260_1